MDPEPRETVAQAMAAPEAERVTRREVAFVHRDGSRVWVLMGLGPLVSAPGAAAARKTTKGAPNASAAAPPTTIITDNPSEKSDFPVPGLSRSPIRPNAVVTSPNTPTA